MTEPAPTAAIHCTTILLRDILDYLPLYDVLRAMGVDRLWRDHALNHPTYYGELYLVNEDPPQASEAFFLRLSRAKGRPVLIHLRREDLRPFMPEISNHLSHVRSLHLRQLAQHPFSPILDALCRPADILGHLSLEYFPESDQTEPEWTLPLDLLAGHAPALDWAIMINVAFPNTIPLCFSHVARLGFGSRGLHTTTFVLPDPFKRCPNLIELNLSGFVALDNGVCRSHHVWRRLSRLTFSGHPLDASWPTFRIPVAAVSQILVSGGGAESTLALADSLSSALDVTFPPLERTITTMPSGAEKPFLFYTAIFRSISDDRERSRVLEDLLTAQRSISAFSMPYLTDRIIRLQLPLDAWDDFAGLDTFGPFNALQELVITLDSDSTIDKAAPSKLFCPRLLRLVLSGDHHLAADIALVASFALAALPVANFPLGLELDGVELTGPWNDYSRTFNAISAPHTRSLIV